MDDPAKAVDSMRRGALPTPPEIRAKAKHYRSGQLPQGPASALLWPAMTAYWGNKDLDGCVIAEEAFARAAGQQQINIPDEAASYFASALGLNQLITLSDGLSAMQTWGFQGETAGWGGGEPFMIDPTIEADLQAVIAAGCPIKIGAKSAAFRVGATGAVTPGQDGWTMWNYPSGKPADHCVSLCGYGSLADLCELFEQHGVTVEPVEGMPTGMCYAMFTWDSIGIIDSASLQAMVNEAWGRDPVSVKRPTPRFALAAQGDGGVYQYDPVFHGMPQLKPVSQGYGFNSGVGDGSGGYYLTAQGGSDGVWRFNPSSSAPPAPVTGTAGFGFDGITRSGTTLYLTGQGSGIYSFDTATSGATPQLLESTDNGSYSGIILSKSNHLLLTSRDGGIFRCEIDDPPADLIAGRGYGFNRLMKSGDMVYLTAAGSDGGVYQYDTSTKTLQQIASTAGYGFQGIIRLGKRLYLTGQGGGIYSIDMSGDASEVIGCPGTGDYGFQDFIIPN